MNESIQSHLERKRPALTLTMEIDDLRNYYWLKRELVAFCKEHSISTSGKKLDILAKIEASLRANQNPLEEELKPSATQIVESKRKEHKGPRDSDQPLTLTTPVKNFKSDEKTREFFKSVIGPHFHFTAHMGDFIREHGGDLTYGDLVEDWLAYRIRRKERSYQPPIMKSCEYNQFVRDFFADEKNRGKPLRAASDAWNEVKKQRGPRTYQRQAEDNLTDI